MGGVEIILTGFVEIFQSKISLLFQSLHSYWLFNYNLPDHPSNKNTEDFSAIDSLIEM